VKKMTCKIRRLFSFFPSLSTPKRNYGSQDKATVSPPGGDNRTTRHHPPPQSPLSIIHHRGPPGTAGPCRAPWSASPAPPPHSPRAAPTTSPAARPTASSPSSATAPTAASAASGTTRTPSAPRRLCPYHVCYMLCVVLCLGHKPQDNPTLSPKYLPARIYPKCIFAQKFVSICLIPPCREVVRGWMGSC